MNETEPEAVLQLRLPLNSQMLITSTTALDSQGQRFCKTIFRLLIPRNWALIVVIIRTIYIKAPQVCLVTFQVTDTGALEAGLGVDASHHVGTQTEGKGACYQA